jgi:hypothetical protein
MKFHLHIGEFSSNGIESARVAVLSWPGRLKETGGRQSLQGSTPSARLGIGRSRVNGFDACA